MFRCIPTNCTVFILLIKCSTHSASQPIKTQWLLASDLSTRPNWMCMQCAGHYCVKKEWFLTQAAYILCTISLVLALYVCACAGVCACACVCVISCDLVI